MQHFIVPLLLWAVVHCQDEESEEEDLEKDILVIPNHFPKRLNWFCYPTNDLMKDRLCLGEVDAFALACAEDSPPLQLVPFCLGYKHMCADANFPTDDWCEDEFKKYRRFCTKVPRDACKSCTHDISCSCEPLQCLWRRHGFATARWCQKYELSCDEKERKEKGTELVLAMQNSIRVHYRCLHLFNFAHVICDPFSSRFDWHRCMKFLFDCELISEWKSEGAEEKEEENITPLISNPIATSGFIDSQRTEAILGKGLTAAQLQSAG